MYNHIKHFINEEMNDLDQRISATGKLNMQEVQYMDILAHAEKSILTSEAMKGYDKKEVKDPMITELHTLMEKAPNEAIKQKYSDFLSEIKGMM